MNAPDKKVEGEIQIKLGSIAGLIAILMLLSWHSVFAQGISERRPALTSIPDTHTKSIEQNTGSSGIFVTCFWTPSKPGIYAVDAGVFGDNWATKYFFKNGAASVTVK